MTRPVTLLASVVALALLPAPAPAGGIEAGVAAVDITPPRGYRMAGYYAERRNTGTRDPLKAKAIVFRQGKEAAALVFCDLVSVPQDVATRAREAAGRKSGIPPARIAVAATHSHTGPLYHGVLRSLLHERALASGGKDDAESVDYPDLLVSKVAQVVEAAQQNLAPVTIRAGSGAVKDLSFNRRFHMKDGSVRFNPGVRNPEVVRPAGPIDPEVGVLTIERHGADRPAAALTVFALHLDTVGGTAYSADYPAALEENLRHDFGPRFLSLFGAGACGDINHIDVSGRTRETTADIGLGLAGEVERRAGLIGPLKDPSLAVEGETIEVALQSAPKEEVAKARDVLARLGAAETPFLETVRAAKAVDLADTYRGGKATRLEVQAFRLGSEVAVVTLPGEVFVEHGLAIKKGSPFRTTFVIELANACPAYVPTRKAFEEGSYEVVNSRVAPGGGEQLVEAALRLLNRLKPDNR